MEDFMRVNCPMRHNDNGNCLPMGGFCTAVNDEICEALHHAYDSGLGEHIEIRCEPHVIATWTLYSDGSGRCGFCNKITKNVWDYDNYDRYCCRCGAEMRLKDDY